MENKTIKIEDVLVLSKEPWDMSYDLEKSQKKLDAVIANYKPKKKINLFDSDNLIDQMCVELWDYILQYRNRSNEEMFNEDLMETIEEKVRFIFSELQFNIDNM